MKDLISWDMEKAEILSDLGFTSRCSSCAAKVAEGKDKNWKNEELSTVGED